MFSKTTSFVLINTFIVVLTGIALFFASRFAFYDFIFFLITLLFCINFCIVQIINRKKASRFYLQSVVTIEAMILSALYVAYLFNLGISILVTQALLLIPIVYIVLLILHEKKKIHWILTLASYLHKQKLHFFAFMRSAKGKKFLTALGIAGYVLSVVFFLVMSYGYIGNDEGSYAYESGLILEGKVPLRDFISRAPVEMYILALSSFVFGKSIYALKAINALFVLLSCFVVYLIIRRERPFGIALFGSWLVLMNLVFFLTKLVTNTTNLSILFVLLGIYLLKGQTSRALLAISGACFALAVFTRESVALFVLFLLAYLFYTRRYRIFYYISIGGIAVTAVILGFFTYHLGIHQAINSLLGVGHLGTIENKIPFMNTVRVLKVFCLSLIPLAGYIAFSKKNKIRSIEKVLYPEYIWLLSMAVFYVFYAFKRGTLFSYMSEFIPVIVIVVFITYALSTKNHIAKKIHPAGIYAAMVFVTCISLFNTDLKNIELFVKKGDVQISKYIGSGVPLANYQTINTVIDLYSRPDSVIFTGNLAFAADNNIPQFMDISRPLAYQSSSELSTIYTDVSKRDIVEALWKTPPHMITLDHHMRATFGDEIAPLLYTTYKSVFQDSFVEIFVRSDTLPRDF